MPKTHSALPLLITLTSLARASARHSSPARAAWDNARCTPHQSQSQSQYQPASILSRQSLSSPLQPPPKSPRENSIRPL
ncbi:hypothetical protein LZ32DRAFT_603434 [Colletotrichum eremochloae]|nr:hypothetical protein LZ32DRAFT_603434 [Colletotrichum eremochloae]